MASPLAGKVRHHFAHDHSAFQDLRAGGAGGSACYIQSRVSMYLGMGHASKYACYMSVRLLGLRDAPPHHAGERLPPARALAFVPWRLCPHALGVL